MRYGAYHVPAVEVGPQPSHAIAGLELAPQAGALAGGDVAGAAVGAGGPFLGAVPAVVGREERAGGAIRSAGVGVGVRVRVRDGKGVGFGARGWSSGWVGLEPLEPD